MITLLPDGLYALRIEGHYVGSFPSWDSAYSVYLELADHPLAA